MRGFQLYRLVILSSLMVALGGCNSGAGFEDLDAFMEETRNKPRGTIEPLPEFQAYKAFTYDSSSRRAPFSPPIQIATVDVQKREESNVKPNLDRPKELLENFSLMDLRMMGSLQKVGNETLWALISDADGGIHRVSVGQYMGKNHGRVVLVEEGKVSLVEIVPNGHGGWLERPRTIALDEQ